jgi:hypothetical protein
VYILDSIPEPVIIINPPYLKVVEGEPAEFRCEITGAPQSSVEWIRSDGRMNSNATFGDGILRIPFVALHDVGEYKCIVRSRDGYSEKAAQLHVKGSRAFLENQIKCPTF